MKKNQNHLFLFLAIPLAIGGVSAFLTRNGMEKFKSLYKPPFTPPGWLFPIAWTVLFLLMGIASYLVGKSSGSRWSIRQALTLYGIQLGFNFLWPILFFQMALYLFAFFWLIFLLLLILLTIIRFYRLSKTAAYLMIPYLLWVAFAGYLNFGVYLLN